jgi:uncharacterized membrane protein YphA (DoxX/SURF4 family)
MKRKITDLLSSLPVQWLSRLVLGGVFIYASIDKIAHPRAFADIVYNYQLLPAALVTIVAVTMPWVEMFSGLCVVSGLFKRAGALLIGAMLLVFSVAITINLARGLDFDCGCFTTTASEGGSDPVGLLIRDILLMIPVIAIVFFQRKKAEAAKT